MGAVINGLLALARAHRPEGPPRPLVHLVACLAPGLAFAVSVYGFLQLRARPEGARELTQTLFTWIAAGPLRVDLGFLLDPLSSVMLLFITGIGFLIHVYSIGYMAHDRGFARYFSYLNLFMFAMILLVLADSLPVLFIGWEGVGLCSYLLIGFWHEDAEKAAAGMKAFIVNRIGDFGFLVGMFVIFWALARASAAPGEPLLSYAVMKAHAPLLAPVATAAGLLLFLGATGKSAQIPLYVWLPDAMAGPTPVSALIHAATMVTSGVYMAARMNFLFVLSPEALTVIAVVGAATALLAATIGLTQFDIKKVLAYSTVSQLGYMFLGVGVGAFAAGIFHVFTHAFFKALLFLGAGSVIHALSGEQDIRKMGGLFRRIPVTAWTFLFGWVAIAGIAPFAGFFSKDEILWRTFSAENALLPWLPKVLWAVALATAGLTALYMTRLVALVFFGRSRVTPEAEHHLHESPRSMTVPLMVLAAGSLLAGLLGPPAFLHLGPNRFGGWLEPVLTAPAAPGTGHAAAAAGHGAVGQDAAVHGAAGHGAVGQDLAVHDAAGSGVAGHNVVGHNVAGHTGAGHAVHDPALEWTLMLITLAVAVAALLIGWRIWTRRPETATRAAGAFGPLYRLVRDRYRVDELYDAAVIRPVVTGSRKFLFGVIDVRIIDFFVNFVGLLTRITGNFVAFLQTGQVQAYGFVLLLGVVIMLFTLR